MKQIILALLATTFAFAAFAQDQDFPRPNKAEVVLAVERRTGGKFLAEGSSDDGRSIRWQFSMGNFHGIPVVLDVSAYPTAVQVDAASVAALAEAIAVFKWLGNAKKGAL